MRNERSRYWYDNQRINIQIWIKIIKENNEKNVELLREFNFDFIRIIEQPSVIILRGKSRAWELVRGVYNSNFNKLSNKKESKKVIKSLWNFIYEEIKSGYGSKDVKK